MEVRWKLESVTKAVMRLGIVMSTAQTVCGRAADGQANLRTNPVQECIYLARAEREFNLFVDERAR